MRRVTVLCLIAGLAACNGGNEQTDAARPDATVAVEVADQAGADLSDTLPLSDLGAFDLVLDEAALDVPSIDLDGPVDRRGDDAGGADIPDEFDTPDLPVEAAWECPDALPGWPECDPDGPPVTVTGNATIFGPPFGYVKSTPVTIVELPDEVALTDGHGDFEFVDLPPCRELTFRIEAEGFVTTYTETFYTGIEPLQQVAFQVPTNEIYDLIATTIGGPNPEGTCNLAGTISVKEMSLSNYIVPHGIDGADVTVCPYPGEGHGPIYFEYITDAIILPDIALEQSSVDGGYIFKGLAPGTYLVEAHKPGASIRTARIECEPGRFINAAPPMGLHELP